METKRTLIIGKDGIKIQTESKHSTTVKNYVGDVQEIFLGDNRLNYDEVRYDVTPNELDEADKGLDKIFTPVTTDPSKKQYMQKRKSKMDTFIYADTRYIKVENTFIRVFPDDFCEKIASSTYYKYQSRLDNEA